MTVNFKILDKTTIRINCIYCGHEHQDFNFNSVTYFTHPNKVKIEFYCSECDKTTNLTITNSKITIHGGFIEDNNTCGGIKDEESKKK